MSWAVLVPEGFAHELEREIAFRGLKPSESVEGFYLFDGEPVPLGWAAVTWFNVQRISAPSISAAARALKPLARKWEMLPLRNRRRATLVLEQLRAFRASPSPFPLQREPEEGVGAFTLLGETELLWCRSFDRPDPLGRFLFEEDRESAPSRAYLKLWEALALAKRRPGSADRCLDLGACPGGWTWVLASLGAQVLAVDRAPLDPRVSAMPGVEFRKGDAFSVLPETTGQVQWLCSDVICAPEKLLELVRRWVESGQASNFVCTLKFQGEADPAVVAEFQRIGRVIHLWHNKHELTFLRLE